MDNCRHVMHITPSCDHSVLNPQTWMCAECATTESVWACLSCPYVACGRYIEEHALKHYQETQHPLALEVNDKYLYCYECEDYVLNDNASGDVKMLRSCLTALTTLTFTEEKGHQSLVRSQSYSGIEHRWKKKQLHDEDLRYTALWFRRYYLLGRIFSAWKEYCQFVKRKLQKKTPDTSSSRVHRKKKRVIIPGITGLRNLGNTCYMNSVLQVLSHLEVFRSSLLKLTRKDSTPTSPTVSTTKLSRPSISSGISTSHKSTQCPPTYSRQSTLECFQHLSEGMDHKGGLSGGSSSSTAKCVHKAFTTVDSSSPVFLHQELLALLRVMWSAKWALVSPHQMLYAVWRLIPFFKGYAQQDAQEFLSEFLDQLKSELKLVDGAVASMSITSKPKTAGRLQKISPVHPVAQLVEDTFQGELVSQITYLRCGHVSQTREPFMDLSLEFPDRYQAGSDCQGTSTACHITEMLKKFTRVENLDGCIYTCDECNKIRATRRRPVYSEATKQLLVSSLPHVLCLHLKRFMWSGRNNRGKIAVNVKFGLELDMHSFCNKWQPKKSCCLYHLVAVIRHHGRGFGSGHYTAYVWSEDAESWVHCNDSRMELCSSEDVLQSQAYILVYSKFNSDENHSMNVSTALTNDLFEEKADEEITFNFKNSTIPRFVELKRKLDSSGSAPPQLKRYKSTMW